MRIKLQDLRRYAIEERVEIAFLDSINDRRAIMNTKGYVLIPGEEKNFKVEEILAAADSFELKGGNGRSQTVAPADLERLIHEMFKSRGVAVEEKEEE